jgi:hypothetical protein
MKARYSIRLIAAAFIAIVAASCSNIDPDERLNYVKPAEVGRAVLIEDFTGQKCPNCPRGTERLNEIVETYGEDNVIVVGIHSGALGYAGTTKNVGLMTDEGNTYYTKWDKENKIGQPWVLINRSQSPNNELDTWMSPVTELISKKAVLSVGISNAYDEATRQLTIDVDAFGTNGSHSGKLQVWLIEDGIVAMQTLGNGSVDRNYVHNHVFRTSVNGTWGEDVSIKEGEHTYKTYNYTLPEKWNAEKVSVVAFVYDDNEVLQVAKKAATTSAEAE